MIKMDVCFLNNNMKEIVNLHCLLKKAAEPIWGLEKVGSSFPAKQMNTFLGSMSLFKPAQNLKAYICMSYLSPSLQWRKWERALEFNSRKPDFKPPSTVTRLPVCSKSVDFRVQISNAEIREISGATLVDRWGCIQMRKAGSCPT